jgi:hypothetical protein
VGRYYKAALASGFDSTVCTLDTRKVTKKVYTTGAVWLPFTSYLTVTRGMWETQVYLFFPPLLSGQCSSLYFSVFFLSLLPFHSS